MCTRSHGTHRSLPVAGLMSNKPIAEVRRVLDEVIGAARNLGSGLHDPFMALSFLALEVILHLKLTDQGLVDVDQFKIVPLWLDDRRFRYPSPPAGYSLPKLIPIARATRTSSPSGGTVRILSMASVSRTDSMPVPFSATM